MTYLELCQTLRIRAGISGSGPDSTTAQIGELALVVSLINTAYEKIQDKFATWTFLKNTFTFPCVVAQSNYATTVVTNFANWREDSFRCYLTDTTNEQELIYYSWDDFRDSFLIGSSRATTGRPSAITINPDKTLTVWPIPDAIYTIGGEYFKKADVMSGDSDTPVFDRFHMLIVYEALMQYAGDVGLPTIYTVAAAEAKILWNKMKRNYLPRMYLGEPLA